MNNSSSLKKAAKVILSVILIAITIVNLLTILFSSIGLRKQLNWVPCALLSVTSDSMKPKFSKGDMILVYDTPYDELNIGDIVTYYDEQGGFTTHELIRRIGDEIITKGLANNTADNPVNRGLYCAKLIAVFPKLGFIVDIFTRPIPAVIAISLIILLFYGLPLIKKVKDDKPEKIFSPMRNITALALASLFAVTPFMTAARYTASINKFESIQAAYVSFKSNYMSQISKQNVGNSYYIQGWDSKPYTIKFDIRNFSNLLRINNIDVPYIINYELVEDAHDETIIPIEKYDLSITPPTDIKYYDVDAERKASYHRDTATNSWENSTHILGPYLLEKSESILSNVFELNISLKDNIKVVSDNETRAADNVRFGDKVKFKIMACTNREEMFYQELLGEFTIELAASENFIVSTISDAARTGAKNTNVTVNITTNLIGTGEPRPVYIYWDAEKMYLDELDPIGFNAIHNRDNQYYNGKDTPKGDQIKGIGSLIIKMTADNNFTFQFLKDSKYYEVSLQDRIKISTEKIENPFPKEAIE